MAESRPAGSTDDLAIPGEWETEVIVQLDEFDEERLTFQDRWP